MSRSGKQLKKDAAANDFEASSIVNTSGKHCGDTGLHQLPTSSYHLDAKLDKLQVVVAGQGQCITDLETNAEEVSQHLQQFEATCSALQEDKCLKSKLSDLEGHSRRQNIQIVGLPESIEGAEPTAFFSDRVPSLFNSIDIR